MLFASFTYAQTTVTCGSTTNTSGVCYVNSTNTDFAFTASDGTQYLTITVNAGEVENSWDEFIVYDGPDSSAPELYNGYGTGGDLTGLTFTTTGPDLFVRIQADGSNDCTDQGYTNLDFDVVCTTPPSCLTPDNLTSTNTDVSADFSWMAGASMETNWEYALLLDTDPEPTSGTGTTMTSYMESGLTPSTGYTFWLRADCGGSDYSDWISTSFTTASGPPPANDNCGAAISLTVNTDLNCGVVTNGTIENATDSGVTGSTCGGTDDDDVWYSFIATNTEHFVSLINITGSTSDMYMALYDSTPGCGSLGAAVVCSDPQSFFATGLTIGVTYYLQVYTWTATTGQTSVFDVCVGTPLPPPVNDDCVGALPLTESTDNSCGNVVSGTTVSASASSEDDCSTTNRDVWYTFMPSTTNSYVFNVTETQDFGFSSTYVSVFEGTCGTLTQLGTACFSNSIVGDLTSGTTYYVNVRSTSTTAGVNFDLCAYPLPPAPSNDECSAAESLTVNADNACAITTSGTTASATASAEDATGVSGTPDNDVWYSFVAVGTDHIVNLLNVTAVVGTSTDMGMAVYDATGTCAGLVFTDTSDPNTLSLTGLTGGTTYFVRVYGWSSTNTAQANFDICVGTLPPPPANDDCSTAIDVMSLPYNNSQDASSATNNSGFIADCGSMNDGVWYTFTPSVDGLINIDITNVVAWDPKLAIYSGSCGSFTCVDSVDSGGAGAGESLNDVAVTGGTTYYINIGQFSGFTDNSEGPFQIDVTDATLSNTEFETPNTFKYFPNPVSNVLSLKAQNNIQNISVYNMLGQEVLKSAPKTISEEIDMSSLRTGAYFVRVTINNVTETIRILKQ